MEKETQQKLIMYQLLERHLASLKQQAILLENEFLELQSTRQAIQDFQKSAQAEVLIPIGSGFFCEGKVTDKKGLLANMGAGIMAKRDAASSLDILEEREKELEHLANSLRQEMERVASKLNKITMEIEELGHNAQEQE